MTALPADTAHQSSAPALEYRGLSFAYPGAEEPVVNALDWTVPAGAFALLVGGTGSGKSTVLSLAKPQIAPAGDRAGEVRAFGRRVSLMGAEESARTIGYVFQNPDNQIVCESVWHEMAFGLENLGTPQDQMRRLVAETSYFFGIDDWFRRDTDTLSGGRKQLLALASTLVMKPRLLLLDEPTAQLDPIAEKNFLHALFRVNRELGCTVVVATHQPRAMLDYATCAFALENGRVRKVDSLDVLAQRHTLAAGERAQAAFGPGDAAVRVSQAWYRYNRDGDWVVRGLDLQVAKGGLHALVGGNGCGKSTLLSLIAGTAKLQRGSLACSSSAKALLPQDPRALFAMETVDDEMMEWSASAGYTREQVDATLGYLGLTHLASLHPYDLSGGQQQLLALGKLLLASPDLLLLDEPTKGLDLPSRRLIAQVLRDLSNRGVTVVMATHDLDFVEQVADEVSMMFDGEIACTQTAEEFFRGNVYYKP